MKYKALFFISIVLLMFGCSDSKPKGHYDGKALLLQKCSSCHNLDMPPKTSLDEKAPPMMAVTFHIRGFMKVNNPSEKRQKFIDFVTDYALYPSAKKSFCDKKSLEDYGIMPSQKGNVSKEELQAIAAYMYDHYDPDYFVKLVQKQARLAALPAYKRVIEQKNCLSCHDIEKDKVAPSFKNIAKRYKPNQTDELIKSIKNGSRGKWEGIKLFMPPYKDLSDSDVKSVVEWILSLKSK